MAPIIKVLVLPTRDYWRSLVSFDYLKNDKLLPLPFERELITFPNVVNDKLIFFNSYKCSVFICYLLLIFYDPARSQRLNRALWIRNLLLCIAPFRLYCLIRALFGILYANGNSLHSLKSVGLICFFNPDWVAQDNLCIHPLETSLNLQQICHLISIHGHSEHWGRANPMI